MCVFTCKCNLKCIHTYMLLSPTVDVMYFHSLLLLLLLFAHIILYIGFKRNS